MTKHDIYGLMSWHGVMDDGLGGDEDWMGYVFSCLFMREALGVGEGVGKHAGWDGRRAAPPPPHT